MEKRVRKFAKEARERLLKNNYDKPQKRVPSGRVFKMADDPNEKMLYEKVCEIARTQSIVTDPLGRLIDQNVYSSMNKLERDRYVFKLSQKYIELLERYRSETLQECSHAVILYD